MNAYIELLRPYNGILAILGIIIGAIVAGTFAFSLVLLLAVVVSFLINGAGNVINDYFDHEIDKINRPKRPIPSGRVKRNSVALYFVVLIAVSLVLAWFVSTYFLYLAAINSLVCLVYSWKLKGTPLLGNLAVSWLAGSTFIGGALLGSVNLGLPILILATIAFLGTLSREIFKDVEDVKGDKEKGAKTLPIVIGEQPARYVASFVLLLGVLSLLLPVYYNLFNVFYYVGVVPAIVVCILALIAKTPHKSQKMAKFAMYFVFLGFLLGTLL